MYIYIYLHSTAIRINLFLFVFASLQTPLSIIVQNCANFFLYINTQENDTQPARPISFLELEASDEDEDADDEADQGTVFFFSLN